VAALQTAAAQLQLPRCALQSDVAYRFTVLVSQPATGRTTNASVVIAATAASATRGLALSITAASTTLPWRSAPSGVHDDSWVVVNPSTRLRLLATASRAVASNVTWTELGGLQLAPPLRVSAPGQPSLVLNLEALGCLSSEDPSLACLLRVQAAATTADGASGSATLAVAVNAPPRGGSCGASLALGGWTVRVACRGWVDEHVPLAYRFAAVSLEVPVRAGLDAHATAAALELGAHPTTAARRTRLSCRSRHPRRPRRLCSCCRAASGCSWRT
jgi:hypothetical protein